MKTTMGVAMRWAVVVMVMGLGACSTDVAADAAGPDVGAQADAAGDAGVVISPLVGRWCSSFDELDLHADGTYQDTTIAAGTVTVGTWASDGQTYLNFIGPNGVAGASQTIVSLTSTTLTMNGFSGTLVFNRCP